LKRRISADSLPMPATGPSASTAAPQNLPINLVVNELLDSGKGAFVNFRLPETADVRDKKEANQETIEIDGIKRKTDVIYVRAHAEKMRLLREYVNMLKLTWRRIDWEVRSENARNEMEMQRVLRRQGDY